MGDELPSRGVEKVNRKGKITLMLVMGLFFSVYFSKNSLVAISADKLSGIGRAELENQVILPRTTPLRFDPMEKVKNNVKKLRLAEKKEQRERLEMAKGKKEISEPRSGQEQKYQDLIADSPLENMLPFIADCDDRTASFLIAIAKKESDFGKHAPKKDGRDCFNYWGYRGTYNQTDSGYSCFDSPEQAISVVGERIRDLLDKKIDTAEKMVVWKCGSTCAGHDPAGVRKWILDVATYYQKAIS